MFRFAKLLLLSLLLAGEATAQEAKWDFDDPEIAAATFGLLSLMLQENYCGKLHIKESIFVEKLKLQKFQPRDIQDKCEKCFKTGLEGANILLKEKGKEGYCSAMIKLFGTDGTMFKGLIE